MAKAALKEVVAEQAAEALKAFSIKYHEIDIVIETTTRMYGGIPTKTSRLHATRLHPTRLRQTTHCGRTLLDRTTRPYDTAPDPEAVQNFTLCRGPTLCGPTGCSGITEFDITA